MVISPFIGLGVAVWLVYKAIALKNECDRYDFENMTDGGVVQYKSFEESRKYQRKRTFSKLNWMLAVYAIFIGLMIWK